MIAKEWLANKSILYFSPHYDDLALSNGGLALKYKEYGIKEMLLINVFTQSVFSDELKVKNKRLISLIRKKEDNKFCKKIGIKSINLDFSDSSLRGYDDYCVDESLVDPIYCKVKAGIKTIIDSVGCDYIFSPLAIGNHIDHLIVFRAINEVIQDSKKVFYYEDLPYSANLSADELSCQIKSRIGNHKIHAFILAKSNLDNKIKNIKIYRSQVQKKDLTSIGAYAQTICPGLLCERLFIKK